MASDALLASVFEFVGTILIGIAVLLTHLRVGREHKIDKSVVKEIRLERSVSITGMILITVGFIIHIKSLGYG